MARLQSKKMKCSCDYIEITIRIGKHEVKREILLPWFDTVANKQEYIRHIATVLYDKIEEERKNDAGK